MGSGTGVAVAVGVGVEEGVGVSVEEGLGVEVTVGVALRVPVGVGDAAAVAVAVAVLLMEVTAGPVAWEMPSGCEVSTCWQAARKARAIKQAMPRPMRSLTGRFTAAVHLE